MMLMTTLGDAMCYGNPSKSLAIAREHMTPEAWAKFEREFEDFCTVAGLSDARARWTGFTDIVYDWAKWAFLSARPRVLVITDWFPCTTPPIRDGWYDVKRSGYIPRTRFEDFERVRFTVSGGWDRESCKSKVAIWVHYDHWRGVLGETE